MKLPIIIFLKIAVAAGLVPFNCPPRGGWMVLRRPSDIECSAKKVNMRIEIKAPNAQSLSVEAVGYWSQVDYCVTREYWDGHKQSPQFKTHYHTKGDRTECAEDKCTNGDALECVKRGTCCSGVIVNGPGVRCSYKRNKKHVNARVRCGRHQGTVIVHPDGSLVSSLGDVSRCSLGDGKCYTPGNILVEWDKRTTREEFIDKGVFRARKEEKGFVVPKLSEYFTIESQDPDTGEYTATSGHKIRVICTDRLEDLWQLDENWRLFRQRKRNVTRERRQETALADKIEAVRNELINKINFLEREVRDPVAAWKDACENIKGLRDVVSVLGVSSATALAQKYFNRTALRAKTSGDFLAVQMCEEELGCEPVDWNVTLGEGTFYPVDLPLVCDEINGTVFMDGQTGQLKSRPQRTPNKNAMFIFDLYGEAILLCGGVSMTAAVFAEMVTSSLFSGETFLVNSNWTISKEELSEYDEINLVYDFIEHFIDAASNELQRAPAGYVNTDEERDKLNFNYRVPRVEFGGLGSFIGGGFKDWLSNIFGVLFLNGQVAAIIVWFLVAERIISCCYRRRRSIKPLY